MTRRQAALKRGGFTRLLTAAALLLLALLASLFGWRAVRAQVASEAYRQRLEDMAADYRSLAEQYNQVVRKTAVTELVVEKNTVCVRVRTAEGVLQTIATPYKADAELYLDYVVLDGRLWIRRVFDAATPPDQALVINPLLGSLNWSNPALAVGKAVYRRLEEGRWVVTVTGDGSLGLVRAEEAESVELSPPPAVRDFAEIETEVRERVADLSLHDLWKGIMGQ